MDRHINNKTWKTRKEWKKAESESKKKREKEEREYRQKAVNELIYLLSSCSLYQVWPATVWEEYTSFSNTLLLLKVKALKDL